MRRSITRAVAAIVATAAITSVGIEAGASAPPDPAAVAAADWLATQQNGAGLVSTGFDPTIDTVAAVSSWTLTGTHPASVAAAMSALSADVNGVVQKAGVDQAGRLAQLVVAVVATGGDPRSFGGTDLLARLTATRTTGGNDDGLYGGPNVYGSAFTDGLVLVALRAAGTSDPGAVAWLTRQQCANGAWTGYRPDPTAPCGTNPTEVPVDTNGTAVALRGLAASGLSPAHDTLGWFASVQFPEGGWGYDVSATASDPDSTGLVMAAIVAAGASPLDAAFTSGQKQPATALRSFQFGPGATPPGQPGALFYPPYVPGDAPTPSVLATNDAIGALLLGAPTVAPAAVVAAPVVLTDQQRFAFFVFLLRLDQAKRFEAFIAAVKAAHPMTTVRRTVCTRTRHGHRVCRVVLRRVARR